MRAVILLGTCVLAIVFASAALGAGNSATNSVYGHKGTKIQHAVAGVAVHKVAAPKKVAKAAAPNKVASAVVAKGTLPFTGLDLGVFAGAGLLLMGMGVSLRRISRKSPPNAS